MSAEHETPIKTPKQLITVIVLTGILYAAKRNGRNRADLYEDLLCRGLVHRPPERGTVELFEAA